MTLQDSLRELVEKWRSRTKGQFFPNAAESSVSWGRNDCADELESLLAAQPPAEPAPTVKLMDLEQKVLGILDELTPEDADVSHPCHQAYQRIGKLFNDALLLAPRLTWLRQLPRVTAVHTLFACSVMDS